MSRLFRTCGAAQWPNGSDNRIAGGAAVRKAVPLPDPLRRNWTMETACAGGTAWHWHGLAVLAAAPVALIATPALAYVGPGAGLTAIGTVLSLLAAVVLAIVGFVWYPIKRFLRRFSNNGRHDRQGVEEREE